MRLEEVIGSRIAAARTAADMTQVELGERIGRYLGKLWSRQSVSSAEKGGRAFTAVELLVIAIELGVPLTTLFVPDPSTGEAGIETPGGAVIPAEQVVRHATPDPEQQALVEQFESASRHAIGNRREIEELKKQVAQLSQATEQALKGSVGEVASRLGEALGEQIAAGTSVDVAELVSQLSAIAKNGQTQQTG